MQTKLLLNLCLYLLVSIFLSAQLNSFQRSKVYDESNTLKIRAVTDTLEQIQGFIVFDSLLSRTDTMKYFHLYCMGRDYAQLNPKLSYSISDSILIHSQRDNYIRGIISAYNLRGILYTYEDDYVKAVTNLKEAILIGENNLNNPSASIKDKYGCTFYYLGDLYLKRNDYYVALGYYQKSLEVFRSFSESDLLKEDLNFTLTSYAFSTIREDKAYAMYSIGRCYLQLNQLDSANHYLMKSNEIVKKTHYDRLQSSIYHSFSILNLAKGDTVSALEYITKSLERTLHNNLNEFTIYNYLKLMEINLARKDFSDIDFIYSNLIKLTYKMNMLNEKARTHQLYSEYLYDIYKPVEAYNELKKANVVRLKLADEDKSREFGKLEAGIKYQKSLYNMKLKSIKAKEEEQRLTSQLYFTVAIAILLLLIAAVILVYARKNKQLNSELTIANDELEQANTKLSELNNTKTKLFGIISHDLRNPINEFDISVKNLLNYPPQPNNTQKNSTLKNLSESASNIHKLLNSLLEWAESQFKDISINKSDVDIEKVINRITSLNKSQIDAKNIRIVTDLKIPTIHTDPNILHTIVRNLIQNSIKYTPSGGVITISTSTEDDFEILDISDSGKGMTQVQIDAILQNSHYQINFDDIKTGSGFGLRLVKDYLDQLDSNIIIESTPDVGTSITIYF